MSEKCISTTWEKRLLVLILWLVIFSLCVSITVQAEQISAIAAQNPNTGIAGMGAISVQPCSGTIPGSASLINTANLVYAPQGFSGNAVTNVFSSYEGTDLSSDISGAASRSAPLTANHTIARLPLLKRIPKQYFNAARSSLKIYYGHTSHGSQVTTGMTGLTTFAGAPQPSSQFRYNDGGAGGALNLAEGGGDLGSNGDLAWAQQTREYLNEHPEVNVVMWSWCGGVSSNTAAGISAYLKEMTKLEQQYPRVTFVYMTGHLDGTGVTGNLNIRNNQIREYCIKNNKVLFDFADIESYNPDNVYYLNRGADDGCNYNIPRSGNWAVQWQNSHKKGIEWYECEAAHTEPLNANMKAYAAWWMWARLSGWNGVFNKVPKITSVSPVSGYNSGPLTVTIAGTDFRTGATVYINKGSTSKKGAVRLLSGTRITCSLPLTGLRPGFWNLTVTNTDGTSAKKTNAFRIFVTGTSPTISSVSPYYGYNNATIPATITGNNFRANATVSLKKGTETRRCVLTAPVTTTRLKCLFPITGARPGYWNLTVRNVDGTTITKVNAFSVRKYS